MLAEEGEGDISRRLMHRLATSGSSVARYDARNVLKGICDRLSERGVQDDLGVTR